MVHIKDIIKYIKSLKKIPKAIKAPGLYPYLMAAFNKAKKDGPKEKLKNKTIMSV